MYLSTLLSTKALIDTASKTPHSISLEKRRFNGESGVKAKGPIVLTKSIKLAWALSNYLLSKTRIKNKVPWASN